MKGKKFYDREWIDKDGFVKESEDHECHEILQRLTLMKERRANYENMWRNALYAFVAFAIYDNKMANLQYDDSIAPEIQSYHNNRISGTGFKFSDTKYPLEFAIVMRKMATEIPNLPEIEWEIDNEDDQTPSFLWKKVYDKIMSDAGSEFELFELWLGKNVFGTSISWSRLEEATYTLRNPETLKNEDGDNYISWDKGKEHIVHEFKSEAVDLRNVLIDDGCKKVNLTDADDCAVFEYLSEDKAKSLYPEIDWESGNFQAVKPAHTFQDINELFGGDANKKLFELIHYYNVRQDKYVRMINGKKAKPTCGIIMKDRKKRKKLPIAFFVDHKVPNSPYGYGEPVIARQFRIIKNKVRNLVFDITKKSAKPTIAIDPLSPFDESKYVWGQDFVRVAPRDMAPIAINANLDPANNLDKVTDNDVIVCTGINITDTANTSMGETATKTVIRKESQVAVVELGMQFNTSVGLKRMHEINADIIRLWLVSPAFSDGENKTIITENERIFKRPAGKEKYTTEKKKGKHVYRWKGDEIDYSFSPVPRLGNIAVTKTLEKAILTEGADMMAKLTPEAIDQEGLAKYIATVYKIPEEVLKQKKESVLDDDPDLMAKKAGAIMPPEVDAAVNNKLNNNAQNETINQSIQDPLGQQAIEGATGAGGVGSSTGAPISPPNGLI